jgi:hypothetical protein
MSDEIGGLLAASQFQGKRYTDRANTTERGRMVALQSAVRLCVRFFLRDAPYEGTSVVGSAK